MDLDLLIRKAGDLCCGRTVHRLELRSSPDPQESARRFHGAVQRLHHQMGQVRHLVNRFDLLRSLRQRGIGSPSRRTLLPGNLACSRNCCIIWLVLKACISPSSQSIADRVRAPLSLAKTSPQPRPRRRAPRATFAHAWHIAGVRIVEALHLCAKDRSAGNDAISIPGFLRRSQRRLCHLSFRSVEPPLTGVHQLDVLGSFKVDLRGCSSCSGSARCP